MMIKDELPNQPFLQKVPPSGNTAQMIYEKDSNDTVDSKSIVSVYDLPNSPDVSSRVLCKLFTVSAVCLIFLIAEIVGGIFAQSLAILSDAAHMFADLSGFFISIYSIWIGKQKASKLMSYGYHRSEVIGAMGSIVLIWVLTIVLLYEATIRIFNKEMVKEPLIMVITAAFGLFCNIVMAKVLHTSPTGQDDGHGNGNLFHQCDHDHGKKGHQHGGSCKTDHRKNTNINDSSSFQSKKRSEGISIAYIDDAHTLLDGENSNHDDHSQCQSHNPTTTEDTDNNHGHQHQNANNSQHDHDQKIICNHSHNHEHDHEEHNDSHHNHEHHNHEHHNHEHEHEHDHDHDHDHHQSHDHNKNHSHKQNKQKKIQSSVIKSKNLSVIEEADNYNLRAAMIHVIGDILQSIGVLIAALLIFFNGQETDVNGQIIWTDWQYADPLCTYLFSILVLFTTFGVAKECLKVLMEATPTGILVNEFEDQFKAIPQVREVHDLHIWALSVGKPAMSVHLVVDDGTHDKVLKKGTKICRHFGIFHSTIQTENSSKFGQRDYIKCDHNIH